MVKKKPNNEGNNKTYQKSKFKKKKTLEDYNFYIGSTTQAADFQTIADYLINHIKSWKRGNDISETLRNLKKIDTETWKPTLLESTAQDAAVKARLNRQYEMEFKAEFDEWMKRKQEYSDNLYRAYGLLWERCNKAMQNRLSERQDFQTKIYNDPIELLKAIKEQSLNAQETRYSCSVITDALRAFLNTKQKENENLFDYTKRFKTARDVLNTQLGNPIILNKYAKTLEGWNEFDDDKKEELTKTASQHLEAFIYLENADQAKYGSVLKGLHD